MDETRRDYWIFMASVVLVTVLGALVFSRAAS